MQKELIDVISEDTSISKVGAKKVYETILSFIISVLAKGENYTIPGFGTFRLKIREAHTGRNPTTGEPIEVPEKVAVSFKPSKAFKEAVQVALPILKQKAEEEAKAPAEEKAEA
mgnify:CR=1 FL=1